MPGSAPSNGNFDAGCPQRSLMTMVWPPMELAEPCRMFAVVTPPARSRKIEMSSESNTSAMFTIEDTETEPSLTLPSTAMCEWQSMMPGVNELAGAVDHQGVRRCFQHAANSGDLSVLDQDVALVECAVRNGEDRGVANQDHPVEPHPQRRHSLFPWR